MGAGLTLCVLVLVCGAFAAKSQCNHVERWYTRRNPQVNDRLRMCFTSKTGLCAQ